MARPPGAGVQTGLVIATHGRHCVVETPSGAHLRCHPRGKKLEAIVGDRVRWQASGDEGLIASVEPRRNLLYRQDELRTKRFAANLDQVLILLAAEPEFSERQLARALIACEAEDITPLIVLNKMDLADAFARAWARLAPYRDMGYTVLAIAAGKAEVAADALAQLAARLQGRTTLLLGPSGAGKSTLVNRLVPDAAAVTGEISGSLGRGRHTTTSTRWYWLDQGRASALIDSPGFQEFGLTHIAPARIADCMPDLRRHLGNCRFHNCTHLHEPGCAVIAQVARANQPGTIHASRYHIYSELQAELAPT